MDSGKMNYKRWYDDDETLSKMIDALKKMNQQTRSMFALDLIQILIEKQPDKDTFLEEVAKENFCDFERWYDSDEMLHSALEMLKHVHPEEKKELYRESLWVIMNEKNIQEFNIKENEDFPGQ
jgi:hypothetical protein